MKIHMLIKGFAVIFGPFWTNVMSFWEHREDPNVLCIQCEHIRKDLEPAIRLVASFLQKELTEEQIEKLKKHLSFDSMKKNKSVNFERLGQLHARFKLSTAENQGTFLRLDYNASIAPEFIKKFDAWTVENTKGTGLSFVV